ncbi:MAG: DUF2007 domain-containing protein [Acidobacteriota bacterium]
MAKRLITIAEFAYPHEAHVLRAALDAAGLQTFLMDEYAVRIGEGPQTVKVQVPEDCVGRARQIIARAQNKRR